MKCKKCGSEVDIGEVYCNKCGTAIQIVPDYNPLEEELEAPFGREEENHEVYADDRIQRQKQQRHYQQSKKKIMQQIILLGLLVIMAAGIATGVYMYLQYQKVHSYDYQYQLGVTYALKQEYGLAVKCFHEALSYKKDDIAARTAAVDAYEALGNDRRVIELLLEIVNLEPTVEYYQRLMEVCERIGDTELMNKILRENEGNEIGEALKKYKPAVVTASILGGQYRDYLHIELSADQENAEIYYTLDGTQPSKNSTKYIEPIALEMVGTFTLRAIAINQSNLVGEELKEVYKIELKMPDPPNISPDSGTYPYPQRIAIHVPEGATGYFTIDGSIPTKENSYIYTEPIEMPIGNSIFSAIIIDKYGTVSGVTKRNYKGTIDRDFSYDAAVIKLKNYLVSTGMIQDLSGNIENGEKLQVQFRALEVISEKECYIFHLLKYANGKSVQLKDKFYAVTTDTGELYLVSLNADGSFQIAE